MGGDTKIFLELMKRLVREFDVSIVTHSEGIVTCRHYGLRKARFYVLNLLSTRLKAPRSMNATAILFQLIKTMEACLLLIRIKKKFSIVYSTSDYWQDVIPALVLKMKFGSKIKWIAGFWLFAPNPFSKESPYKGISFLKGILFYLYQKPIYILVKKYADMVFVTSEPDAKKFITKNRDESKILIVKGGVDISQVEQVQKPINEKYSAVFVGRFHPMKGVVELIHIWNIVTRKKPDAKLCMIGVGPLIEKVKAEIKKYGLEKNIELLGFLDGIDKIKILKSSKIVVHPSIYDSGGFAAIEAMACGLPGVCFDLPALKTYYPRGMLKAACFDLNEFANNVLRLLEDNNLYGKLSKEAIELAKQWDWNMRAQEVADFIKRNLRQ
jgi:glycosyltransferase involved in cell wall biosynthesis